MTTLAYILFLRKRIFMDYGITVTVHFIALARSSVDAAAERKINALSPKSPNKDFSLPPPRPLV